MEKTLGGDRLGGGDKQKINMHDYNRSNHDLSYVMRTTMSSGTLVPFMKKLMLPGDTFDIDLDIDCLTHPTIGPLFGSFTIYLDLFECPVRLYQSGLHMNLLGIGLNMSAVKFPLMTIKGKSPVYETEVDPAIIDNIQVNPSCILKYLGVSGAGNNPAGAIATRQFQAIPLLAIWDIYKNYYANKQEGIGAVIHKVPNNAQQESAIATAILTNGIGLGAPIYPLPYAGDPLLFGPAGASIVITVTTPPAQGMVGDDINFLIQNNQGVQRYTPGTTVFQRWYWNDNTNQLIGIVPNINTATWPGDTPNSINILEVAIDSASNKFTTKPEVVTFPLSDIDAMKIKLLKNDYDTPYVIDGLEELTPYKYLFESLYIGTGPVYDEYLHSMQYAQEGLPVRTYKSDLFNNWLDTEWIDGVDGVSAVTAVSTAGDSFTIDEFNLKSKIYVMLNRIAVSGGSYDDWQDAVYTQKRNRSVESPMYAGGLITNLVFQEVVGLSQTENQPLGTLAGRGKIGGFRKGGKAVIKADEAQYLIGLVSIVPNIDYSQGNEWDMNLKTMDDLHKPALDAIGFQDLLTDQMAWWDTEAVTAGTVVTKSAGKQPAWINYMTEVNRVYGNFADQNQQMFMVLNRRYEPETDGLGAITIKDLTTYIDPSKFNHIFADTSLDAQNFWMQIAVKIEARRLMSAKVIPNL